MIGASQLTPTQSMAIERHKAFRRKIAAKAVRDEGICLRRAISTPAVVEEVPPAPPLESLSEWAKRQWKAFAWPWFSMVDERPAELPPPSIAEIQRACAEFFGVKRHDITSARRTWNIVRPRQIGYYLCKELTGKSLPEIGRRFGMRDHTTILHGIRKIEKTLLTEPQLAADIQSVRELIAGRA